MQAIFYCLIVIAVCFDFSQARSTMTGSAEEWTGQLPLQPAVQATFPVQPASPTIHPRTHPDLYNNSTSSSPSSRKLYAATRTLIKITMRKILNNLQQTKPVKFVQHNITRPAERTRRARVRKNARGSMERPAGQEQGAEDHGCAGPQCARLRLGDTLHHTAEAITQTHRTKRSTEAEVMHTGWTVRKYRRAGDFPRYLQHGSGSLLTLGTATNASDTNTCFRVHSFDVLATREEAVVFEAASGGAFVTGAASGALSLQPGEGAVGAVNRLDDRFFKVYIATGDYRLRMQHLATGMLVQGSSSGVSLVDVNPLEAGNAVHFLPQQCHS